MINIIFAFLIIGVLGIVLGLGLSIAEKKLKTEKDEKLEALEAIMPGANCGGCGYAGCASYAEAVRNMTAKPGLCSPGGEALSQKMAQIMGVEAEKKERMRAFVFCRGNSEVTKSDYNYDGISSCEAASLLFGGPESCKEGCMHMGSCLKVCPSKAISKGEKGNIVVDKEKCTGCGLCVRTCPTGAMRLIPYNADFVVACGNHDSGAKARKKCAVSCIGCKICEVKVESSPFKVENFLSTNNYNLPQDKCEEASLKCPQNCIVRS